MQSFLKMKAGNIPMPPLRVVAIIGSNLLTHHSRKPKDLCKSAFLFCLLPPDTVSTFLSLNSALSFVKLHAFKSN